jgi:hypothetical protein
MKRIFLALVALSSAYATPVMAQNAVTPSSAPHTKVERELLDLSRAKWRWMAEKKVDTLSALFHDEAVFVHMGGTMSRA